VVRAMAQLDLIKWSHVLIQGQRNLDGSEAQGSLASANSSLPLSSHLVHALLAKIGRSLAGALPSTRIQDTSEACDGAFYLDASASCASCAVHARPTVKYVDKNAQLEACKTAPAGRYRCGELSFIIMHLSRELSACGYIQQPSSRHTRRAASLLHTLMLVFWPPCMVHRRVDVPHPHHYVSMHEHCRVEVTMHVYLAVAIIALVCGKAFIFLQPCTATYLRSAIYELSMMCVKGTSTIAPHGHQQYLLLQCRVASSVCNAVQPGLRFKMLCSPDNQTCMGLLLQLRQLRRMEHNQLLLWLLVVALTSCVHGVLGQQVVQRSPGPPPVSAPLPAPFNQTRRPPPPRPVLGLGITNKTNSTQVASSSNATQPPQVLDSTTPPPVKVLVQAPPPACNQSGEMEGVPE
jgi:hypothetical protein